MQILYEDNQIIAVNKPAGMLVYLPEGFRAEETVLDSIKNKFSFQDPDERSGVVHRLDRDTSGVLLFAKNKESESRLKSVFKNREIIKHYLALVWGELEHQKAKIDIPLGRGAKDRLKVVPKGSGKNAETLYEVSKYYKNSGISLLDVEIKTGRTHQIRVHFSAIGHPVVGDQKYSKRKEGPGRQCLHAARVSFKHPFTGKELQIEAPIPADLKTFLNQLS